MVENTLLKNYGNVVEALARACAKNGREPGDVTLVAVSKFHSAADMRLVANAGQIDFGENYVQEAQEKKAELSGHSDIRWHMIGHVQSRKAEQVAGNFALIHTLDSLKLANAYERHLENLKQPVLIEVNLGGEKQKAGVGETEVRGLARHVVENCQHLDLRGLMCIPPVFDAGEAARPYFVRLRKLRDSLEQDLGMKLPELSMGMSGDFEAAVAEGATIVRIGTAIFGPRST